MSGEWKKDWDRKGIEEKKRHESEGGGVEREWKNEREREREKERERERERKGEKREKHEGLFLVGLQEPASVWLGLRKV